MMKPNEIAALYNHIRKTGYGKSVRTEIAGMLFEASKRSSLLGGYELRVSRIGDDDSFVWYIDFNLSQEVYRKNNNNPLVVEISLFKPIPNSINKSQSSRIGLMSNIKSFGDLKTQQHDCTLLRMFSSEWMPDET